MRSSERFCDLSINGHFHATNSVFCILWPKAAASNSSARKCKAISEARCFTRDGWLYPGFGLEMFRKLKRKKAISSSGGKPYRITERGLVLVRRS